MLFFRYYVHSNRIRFVCLVVAAVVIGHGTSDIRYILLVGPLIDIEMVPS